MVHRPIERGSSCDGGDLAVELLGNGRDDGTRRLMQLLERLGETSFTKHSVSLNKINPFNLEIELHLFWGVAKNQMVLELCSMGFVDVQHLYRTLLQWSRNPNDSQRQQMRRRSPHRSACALSPPEGAPAAQPPLHLAVTFGTSCNVLSQALSGRPSTARPSA